jgi:hypothetical protein
MSLGSDVVAQIKQGIRSQYRPKVAAGLEAMILAIGDIAQDRTIDGVDVYGAPFAPHSPHTRVGAGILVYSGTMVGSISSSFGGAAMVDDLVDIRAFGVTSVHDDEGKVQGHLTGHWFLYGDRSRDVGVRRDFLGEFGGLSAPGSGRRAAEVQKLKQIFRSVVGNHRVRLTFV